MSYCSKAFNHLYADGKGRYTLCCYADVNPDLKKYTTDNTKPFEFFLSDEMESIRNDMLEGKPIKGCEVCYKTEAAGHRSHRLTEPQLTEIEPHSVDVKIRIFGSACNLSCYMCHPFNSSSRNKELQTMETDIFEKEDPDFYKVDEQMVEVNSQDVLDNLNLVRSIVVIGGEPFIMTPHWKFLDSIPDEMKRNITLDYQTNLTKPKHMQWDIRDYLPKFRSVQLQVSSDHFGERLAWIRYPIDVEQFESNLREFKEYIPWINVTVSMLNALDLTDIVNYYQDNFGIPVRLSSRVRNPAELSIKNFTAFEKAHVERELKNLEGIIYIPEFMYDELEKDASEEEYQKFVAYVKELDKKRKTDVNGVFRKDIY